LGCEERTEVELWLTGTSREAGTDSAEAGRLRAAAPPKTVILARGAAVGLQLRGGLSLNPAGRLAPDVLTGVRVLVR